MIVVPGLRPGHPSRRKGGRKAAFFFTTIIFAVDRIQSPIIACLGWPLHANGYLAAPLRGQLLGLDWFEHAHQSAFNEALVVIKVHTPRNGPSYGFV